MYSTRRYSEVIMYFFCATIIFVANSTPAPVNKSHLEINEKQYLKNDTNQNRLQHLIDSVYNSISLYTDLGCQKDDLQDQIKDLTKRDSILFDSLQKLNGFNIEAFCAELAVKKNSEGIKANLKKTYNSIAAIEKGKEKFQADIKERESSVKDISIKINNAERNYIKGKEAINNFANTLSGPGYFVVKNVKFRFYIARWDIDSVYIHNNKKRNAGQSLNDIMVDLKKINKEPLMITNAGMYTPSFEAQGLLIENFKEIKGIDTLEPDNKTNLNFYMKPNGVFYIDSTGFNISKTKDYKAKYSDKNRLPRFATQSGPMLLTDENKNPNFKYRSTNLNIRSGVGVINKKKIVFIISDTPVNFYDFASVFDDIFNCKNALYLDGAISKMYIDENLSGLQNPYSNDGAFGPIISISKNKK